MASTRPPRPGDSKKSGANHPVKPVSATKSTTSRPSGTSAASRRPTPAGRNVPPPKNDSKLPVLLIGGILLVFAVGIAAFVILNGGNNATNNTNPASTGSQGIEVKADPTAKVDSFPSQGQDHIAVNAAHLAYNSDPPTSGPHYANPVRWGVYDKLVPDEYLVHNLEHGGIVINYVCDGDCTAAINQLSNYARRYSPDVFTGILLAPRNSLPDGAKVSLTAWTKRLLLKSVDTQKIDDFIKTYFNKGPESAG
jgi:hypothetical protein